MREGCPAEVAGVAQCHPQGCRQSVAQGIPLPPLSRPPAAQAQLWLCGRSPRSRLTTASPSFWAGTREGRCVSRSLPLLTSQVT